MPGHNDYQDAMDACRRELLIGEEMPKYNDYQHAMDCTRRELLSLLRKEAVLRGDFTLSSGAKSDYYIDARKVTTSGDGLYLMEDLLPSLIDWAQSPPYGRMNYTAVGGPACGAIPMASTISLAARRNGEEINSFWVRGEPKGHGAKKLIEGCLRPVDRVVIMDDTATSGLSLLHAVDAVREIGAVVLCVLVLVDRMAGAEELLRENGVSDYRRVFTVDELLRKDEPEEEK